MTRDPTAEIERIIELDDPIGIAGPDNVGEYSPEAEEIVAALPLIESERDLRAVIHDIFGGMFGPETAGGPAKYESIAHKVWAISRAGG